MSAGAFQLFRYQRNDGEIHPIRLQPETEALVIEGIDNDQPAGAATRQTLASVSKSNTAHGLRPRKINVKFTGTPPTGYKADQTYCLPALQPAIWNAAVTGATGTYLGVAVEVVSRGAENLK